MNATPPSPEANRQPESAPGSAVCGICNRVIKTHILHTCKGPARYIVRHCGGDEMRCSGAGAFRGMINPLNNRITDNDDIGTNA